MDGQLVIVRKVRACQFLKPRRLTDHKTDDDNLKNDILALTCATALSGIVAGYSTTPSETPIQELQRPAPVLTAFCKQFPSARHNSHVLGRKGPSTFCELAADGNGAPHSLIYTPSGELAETEIVILFEESPAAVQAVAKRASIAGVVKLAEIAQKKGKTY